MALKKLGVLTSVQCRLAQSRFGRTLLHLGCLVRGGRVFNHLRGISRAWRPAPEASAPRQRKPGRRRR